LIRTDIAPDGIDATWSCHVNPKMHGQS